MGIAWGVGAACPKKRVFVVEGRHERGGFGEEANEKKLGLEKANGWVSERGSEPFPR